MNNISRVNQVRQISLFSNLDEKILEDITGSSQIISHKKDKVIFFQGEDTLNFYIILEGAVKLFASDLDGDETVLQIISSKAASGNFINDVFCDQFQSSSQAIEDCTILAIPLQVMRRILKKDLVLATNFNFEISLRNKELFGQLARLRLSDAKEKLGRFLLGAAFKNSGNKTREVELKCSKTVIASYLGINPETLSRTFKKLKDDGEISIEKNKITFLEESSLCGYCDGEIHAKCKKSDSDFCKNNFF